MQSYGTETEYELRAHTAAGRSRCAGGRVSRDKAANVVGRLGPASDVPSFQTGNRRDTLMEGKPVSAREPWSLGEESRAVVGSCGQARKQSRLQRSPAASATRQDNAHQKGQATEDTMTPGHTRGPAGSKCCCSLAVSYCSPGVDGWGGPARHGQIWVRKVRRSLKENKN